MGCKLASWYSCKCKKTWKVAFFATVIIALLVHLYKFTNALPNHDTLYNYFGERNRIGSGRWFLCFGTLLTSNFSLPWLNAVATVFFMAMTVVLLVEIFEINNHILIALAAAILVTYPSTTGTFFYQYTMDIYSFGMFLCSMAVLLTLPKDGQTRRTTIIKTIVAVLLLTLSVGIYQAYLSFALVLSLSYFIIVQFKNRLDGKTQRNWICIQIILYVSGVALYYLIWKIFQAVTPDSSIQYQGIDELGLSISVLVSGLKKTALQSVVLFVDQNPIRYGVTPYGIINTIFLAMAIITLLIAIIKTKIYRRKGSFLLLILALIAIPFAIFIWFFTSPSVWYRCTMMQSAAVFYVLIAVLCEEYLKPRLRTVAVLVLLAVICNNAISANIAYFYWDKAYTSTYFMASEINMRAHLEDEKATTIAVVGLLNDNNSLYLPTDATTNNLPRMLREEIFSHLLLDQDHVVNFINHSFGEDYAGADADTIRRLSEDATVQSMPSWPAAGSVKSIDDIIVIKVQDVSQGG